MIKLVQDDKEMEFSLTLGGVVAVVASTPGTEVRYTLPLCTAQEHIPALIRQGWEIATEDAEICPLVK